MSRNLCPPSEFEFSVVSFRLWLCRAEVIDLYKIGDHMNNVPRFVRAELSRIAKSLDPAGRDGKWSEEQKLVGRSGGHMLYAATVIRHIDNPYDDDHESSPDIEHYTLFFSPYELYRQIVRSCPPKNRPHMMQMLWRLTGPTTWKIFVMRLSAFWIVC
ncbi:hypothetical protein H1R20_g10732, partial [Candolleomyces eurysporus]